MCARNTGYVWSDDSRWNIDTPETPHSILALIMYHNWVNRRAADLRNATLSVYLRGDHLDLKGGQCFFWAWNLRTGTRWHYSKQSLVISRGKRADQPNVVMLKNDESLWHRSWAIRYPEYGSRRMRQLRIFVSRLLGKRHRQVRHGRVRDSPGEWLNACAVWNGVPQM